MHLEHKYISVNKVNIHYVESGPQSVNADQITTIIFLHGFPEYWGTWAKQLRCFSKNYRVIAPDLPGYNLSDKPDDLSFYRVPNLINFIAKFIALISPEQQVYLVAHDWGGAIAWPLAAFHPHLINKLIILNAAHPSTFTREMLNNPIQRQKSAYIHQLISASGEALLAKNNYQFLTDKMMVSARDDIFTEAVKAKYRHIWSQAGAINGMLQYYRAMPQLAADEATAGKNKLATDENSEEISPVKSSTEIKVPNIRIDMPTLILWAEQDTAFVNEVLDDIERYVTHCTVNRFSNTSHWLQHEQPDAVNKAIATFINS